MMLSGEKRTEALRLLKDAYPDARPALHFSTPFELLVATMLSAQCTDKQVNKVTDVMFQIYRTAKDFAAIDLETLEPYIHSCGFFRAKGQNILAMSRILCEKYGGVFTTGWADEVFSVDMLFPLSGSPAEPPAPQN